jgi:hypothetical protein
MSTKEFNGHRDPFPAWWPAFLILAMTVGGFAMYYMMHGL